MKQQLSGPELVVVLAAMILGCLLRCSDLDRLAIEHFDEGVYASTVWYPKISSEPYPARHLYAPPALPIAIQLAGFLAGPDLAPVLPSLVAGCLTIFVLWGFVRSAFGQVAGMIVVTTIAFSDFHILYSRMALTDAPVMFWIVLAVWLGLRGIDRQSVRDMLLAGLCCGVGWWFKYSGWLPLAIVSSGSAWWWMISGRQECSPGKLLRLNAAMVLSAVVVWMPWLWSLQDVGGYAAVSANHAGYVTAWSSWSENLATQLTWHVRLDSWLPALGLLLGMGLSGAHRWFTARRSTWNTDAASGSGVTPGLLLRFTGAGVLLSVSALAIGSLATLLAAGLGGVAGIALFPTLKELQVRGESEAADRNAAPGLNPQLAACLVTAWFCGMLLMTPRYTPFPRLLLPLLTSVWIAAAAGIGWWVEACVNVARRSATSGEKLPQSVWQLGVGGMVLGAIATGVWITLSQSVPTVWTYESRRGLQTAANEVAGVCREAAGVSTVTSSGEPGDDPQLVVYGFGEPAALYHLQQAGILALPVQDVNFPPATLHDQVLPTFLVFGPNALRTDGFLYDWLDQTSRFEHVADVRYETSQVVLFNLFPPKWLQQHTDDELHQTLEVYQLRSSQVHP